MQQDRIIEASGIWKVFGDTAAINCAKSTDPTEEDVLASGGVAGLIDANIDVYRGEIFMIMGLSGSGKSTLLRCLTGLYSSTRGKITIGDTELTSATKAEMVKFRRKKISMVFQNFALLPHLNSLDNVAFPLRVQGTSVAERRKIARDTLKLVGLEGKEGFFPSELSGGQQQRVGIARSLVTNPDVWFLDEPFSALDPLIRREMQDEFRRLQEQLHKTIIFVTHDLEEAVRLGDRIVVMEKGRIVQIGTPEELILKPVNDYVRKFVAGLSKDTVIKVRSILEPLEKDAVDGQHVKADATLSEVTRQIVESVQPLKVEDAAGKIIGQVSRQGLAQWLT
ncbi:ATP-binding cassette domain-containing protein [Pseudohalocynthiibacter aestuariivivens]|nr:ATP-binding cassette domain-containing protein [Pseudohalocynthiibacter aestuariivivens]